MFKTIVFNGGLGNQMFQYAFYLRIKKEHPISFFLFNIKNSQGAHWGFELDNVFFIDSTKQTSAFSKMERHCPLFNNAYYLVKQDNCFEYVPQICELNHFFIQYDGYWQNAEYFKPIEQQVRSAFSFRKTRLNDETKKIKFFIDGTNSVSVHVRRGDYIQHSIDFGLCSKEYYENAISLMRKNIDNPFFYIFSDDIEWAKQNIKCDNSVYVDWNSSSESWQDMYLMSCCKHNIIANSSFSWWGAWLNNNVNKKVIAPSPWVNTFSEYDFIPNNWIRIKK
jgi:hypothetical protein